MTIKKFKLFLASDVEKEEQWLPEMSHKGFHFKKYRFGMYYFDEEPNQSYVYQIDFREADDDYFQLYEDAGWQHIDSCFKMFHYFRTEDEKEGVNKIYSDKESVKETLQRMMRFYIGIYFATIASGLAVILTWKGYTSQKILVSLLSLVLVLYLYLFFGLKRRIDYYK